MLDGGKGFHVAAGWHDATEVGSDGSEKGRPFRLLPHRYAHQEVRLDVEDDRHGVRPRGAGSFLPLLCLGSLLRRVRLIPVASAISSGRPDRGAMPRPA